MRTSFLLACALVPCRCYEKGDMVALFSRSQILGRRSGWLEASTAAVPRFAQNGEVTFHPVGAGDVTLQEGTDFKVSLSFADDRFIVPWVPLATDGERVESLRVEFVHDDRDILELHWSITAQSGASSKRGRALTEGVQFHYHWRRRPREDGSGALNMLYALSVIAFITLCVQTLLS